MLSTLIHEKIDEPELNAIFNSNKPTLALGDFNAKNKKQNSRLTTTKGRRLQQYTENRICKVYFLNEPTIIPVNNGLPDVIDITLVKIAQKHNVNCIRSSNHNPVLTIKESYLENSKISKSYSNWEKFQV